MQYFDFETVAHEAGITDEELGRIVARARQEFPSDEMMAELHALRACMAVRDGHCTLEAALAAEPVRQANG